MARGARLLWRPLDRADRQRAGRALRHAPDRQPRRDRRSLLSSWRFAPGARNQRERLVGSRRVPASSPPRGADARRQTPLLVSERTRHRRHSHGRDDRIARRSQSAHSGVCSLRANAPVKAAAKPTRRIYCAPEQSHQRTWRRACSCIPQVAGIPPRQPAALLGAACASR